MASESAAEAIRHKEFLWRRLVAEILETYKYDGSEDRHSLILESLERREHQTELSVNKLNG